MINTYKPNEMRPKGKSLAIHLLERHLYQLDKHLITAMEEYVYATRLPNDQYKRISVIREEMQEAITELNNLQKSA